MNINKNVQDNRKKLLTFLPFFSFLSIEIIRNSIRPYYLPNEYPFLAEVFGWLPNLLAAFAIITLGMLFLMFIEENTQRSLSYKNRFLFLLLTTFVSIGGLIWHEFSQIGTNLYFDINDIYATLIGGFSGFSLYFILVKKKE